MGPTDQEYDTPVSRMRCGRDVTVFGHAMSVVKCLDVIEFRLFVFEHRHGVLEGNAMFGSIGLGFLPVPFEFVVLSHHCLDGRFNSC